MTRYLLTISYFGADYCGWQVQPNGVSVQQVLGEAITKVFGAFNGVTGCSRTDSGVHAKMFCCHTDIETDMSPSKIVLALNNNTPDSIAVMDCKIVESDFHARYNCVGKNYIYKVWNKSYMSPFLEGRAFWYKHDLNISDMQKAAEMLCGTHDFSSFCAANSSVADKVRTITKCAVTEKNGLVEFSVSADGFLYNMVRIIVGTLLEIGVGKIKVSDVDEIINSKNRESAGFTVPAHGLYLNEVFY